MSFLTFANTVDPKIPKIADRAANDRDFIFKRNGLPFVNPIRNSGMSMITLFLKRTKCLKRTRDNPVGYRAYFEHLKYSEMEMEKF